MARLSDPYPASMPPMWQRIALAPLGALLNLMAWLPTPLVRGLADMIAWLAGPVIGYRRRVVRRNLADCFPEMTIKERRQVEKQFYRNLADYFFQTARLAHLSPARIARHISFSGLDQLAEALKQGRDVVLYTSHFGNWEYITTLANHMPGFDDVVFAHVARPLRNLWFNRFFHRLRSRFNVSVPMRQTARTMIGWRKQGQQFIIGFLSDQKPGHNTRAVTVDFLGRPTPFIGGTEDLARKFKCAVFYTDVHRLGRDRFEVHLVPVADDASLTEPGFLTATYASLLSTSIRRDPASYLWSHNRWKIPRKK